MITPEGLQKNFYKVLDINLIMQVNFDGVNNKEAFKNFPNLNKAIFGMIILL